jgi:acetyl-CoA acetyltransferase
LNKTEQVTDMSDVYIIGSYSTAFGRRPQDTIKDLAREAYEQVLSDAGFDDGDQIESSWFGNCGMWTDEQGSIRGQVCFTPLVREGRFPERIPTTNVEGGCATGSLALNGAWKDVLSGQADVSIAMGVESISVASINTIRRNGRATIGMPGKLLASHSNRVRIGQFSWIPTRCKRAIT